MKLSSKPSTGRGRKRREGKINRARGWYCLQRTEIKTVHRLASSGSVHAKKQAASALVAHMWEMKINAVVGKRGG